MASVPDLTGVVLAGGASRRMGQNKAFLEIGGEPLIVRVLRVLHSCCSDVFIVAKDAGPYRGLGVRVVLDDAPLQSPLVGVCRGLREMGTRVGFVAACDLPQLSADAVRMVAGLVEGYDAAVPRVQGRWHPLHAAYTRGALGVLETRMAAGDLAVRTALEALRVRAVDEDELRRVDATLQTLCNINTPQQYRALPGATRKPL